MRDTMFNWARVLAHVRNCDCVSCLCQPAEAKSQKERISHQVVSILRAFVMVHNISNDTETGKHVLDTINSIVVASNFIAKCAHAAVSFDSRATSMEDWVSHSVC